MTKFIEPIIAKRSLFAHAHWLLSSCGTLDLLRTLRSIHHTMDQLVNYHQARPKLCPVDNHLCGQDLLSYKTGSVICCGVRYVLLWMAKLNIMP
jgi:hypothetical protein